MEKGILLIGENNGREEELAIAAAKHFRTEIVVLYKPMPTPKVRMNVFEFEKTWSKKQSYTEIMSKVKRRKHHGYDHTKNMLALQRRGRH